MNSNLGAMFFYVPPIIFHCPEIHSCSIRNFVTFVAQYVIPWKRAVFFYGECDWAICNTKRVNRRISARDKILLDVLDSAAPSERIHQQVFQVRIGSIH